MAFWSQANIEPKRGNRFLLYLNTFEPFVIKAVDKPKFSISKAEHKFGQHTFKWPGSTVWDDINVTIVDAVSPDSTKQLVNSLVAAGYKAPTTFDNSTTFMSKAANITAIGTPIITQIDVNGQPIEKWTLHNAFITKVDFGKLDYSQDTTLIDISLTFAFDYATLEGTPLSK